MDISHINELTKLIQKAWSQETSYTPEDWSQANPALGQCAITAVIVQDYLGWEILWTEATLPDGQKISHYFNKIDDKEVDLTRMQFPKGTKLESGSNLKWGELITRERILQKGNTQERYDTLKSSLLHQKESLQFNIKYLFITLILLILEISIARYVSSGWVRGFLGDAIVIVLMYSFFRIFEIGKPLSIAVLSVAVAFLIEILQALRIGAWLGVTGVWRIVLGATFDWMDIVAYMCGFLVCVILAKKIEK